jgi:CheY-like chemotaxis protein
MANSKVVIDIIAPNARTFNMLEFVLQQHGKGRFEMGRGNRPDLVVVDFDKSDVKSAFRKYRSRFPEIPAVLLLNQAEEYEALHAEDRMGAEFLLLKPFAAKDFIAKINECLGASPTPPVQPDSSGLASNKDREALLTGVKSIPAGNESSSKKSTGKTVPLQTSAVGNQPAKLGTRQRSWEPLESRDIAYSFALASDIDMSDDAAVKNIWLKTDNKLLGYLRSAISQQKSAQSAVCLSVHDGMKLHISPYARTIAITGESVDLSELSLRDFSNGQVSISQSAMPDKNIKLQLEMESFLWKLALYSYRGYLPEGININKPVYLKYWPNLTRLEPTPNAMRIASLLSRQPVALAFIVRILNIPQSHVFNFYAAANASGFAGPAVREVDNMLLPSYLDELGNSPVRGYNDNTPSQNSNT